MIAPAINSAGTRPGKGMISGVPLKHPDGLQDGGLNLGVGQREEVGEQKDPGKNAKEFELFRHITLTSIWPYRHVIDKRRGALKDLPTLSALSDFP